MLGREDYGVGLRTPGMHVAWVEVLICDGSVRKYRVG